HVRRVADGCAARHLHRPQVEGEESCVLVAGDEREPSGRVDVEAMVVGASLERDTVDDLVRSRVDDGDVVPRLHVGEDAPGGGGGAGRPREPASSGRLPASPPRSMVAIRLPLSSIIVSTPPLSSETKTCRSTGSQASPSGYSPAGAWARILPERASIVSTSRAF